MDIKRQIIIAGIVVLSVMLWTKWQNFQQAQQSSVNNQTTITESVPTVNSQTNNSSVQPTLPSSAIPSNQESIAQIITVDTDLATFKINTQGGSIESMVLKKEAVSAKTPEIGFELLKNTPTDLFISQSGLIGKTGGHPNHSTLYSSQANNYSLANSDRLEVPLFWTSPEGNTFIKKFIFNRDSYVIDIEYQATNNSNTPLKSFLYAQFKRTQPIDENKGSFMQLPSFMGGVKYTPEEKYDKISFKDIQKEKLAIETNEGWVGMLQHYFAGIWMPVTIQSTENAAYSFYSNYVSEGNPQYIMGYKTLQPLTLSSGETGTLITRAFIGPKEQSRLKAIEKKADVKELSLSVDYGWLTVIADPLFWVLDKIHSLTNNWGWAIIILTILIKLAFFPLSAASYKSMAKMKKLQPRMEVLKERYGDDRQGMQQEMMKLYKEEKVNPAGGCLPILIQIPVFIALYYVLLESVEMRHAPFALWLQDLSSKDPYYVLPIIMGLSMVLQFRLNPAPMEPMQQKIMMFMPIMMTFLFLTFPSGLVLYWVVNNILSIAQQWTINRTIGKEK